ncbi:Lacal_2735 family protein [Aquimarina agarivorans]|uniref:Lacal_2735 family protein n=1 Tax=Aquimarina agarivorans TaxID=980584 RepID=UPI001110D86F|nr:Lacal_2735 family protein [Aquimarina agarivorans]
MQIYNFKNRKQLMSRYMELMEESYNLKQTDAALSDYDYYEAIKIRRCLELQYRQCFGASSLDLLD